MVYNLLGCILKTEILNQLNLIFSKVHPDLILPAKHLITVNLKVLIVTEIQTWT